MQIDGNKIRYQKNKRMHGYIKDRHVLAVVVNDKLEDLNYLPSKEDEIVTVLEDGEVGKEIYLKSLLFLFNVTIKKLSKHINVTVRHSLVNGLYLTLENAEYLSFEKVEVLMKEMIAQSLLIKKMSMSLDKAKLIFKNDEDKLAILKELKAQSITVYKLDKYYDFFLSDALVYDTSYLKDFEICPYRNGIWIGRRGYFHETKLFDVFMEYERWGSVIGVSNVAELNAKNLKGKFDDLVLMSEIVIDRQLLDLTSSIVNDNPETRIILIAGPSSAGKTTFSNRLALHLKLYGKNATILSMDDFYKNREDTPRFADGSYDFENPEAVDLKLFQSIMSKLLQGKRVKFPSFNFKTGQREYHEGYFKLKEDDLLIVEGIHGLNPLVTKNIDDNMVYRIYINALTHLNIDNHNHIKTSDYRLIRRIVRDKQFRNYPAKETIDLWSKVVRGENLYIYPYQENAKWIFNSSMVYELAILKPYIVPELLKIKEDEKEYMVARRLLKIFRFIKEATSEVIPATSILKEFIGGSYFDVH